jgi:hypothetical protein
MNNHIPDAGKMACPKCGAEVLNPEGSQRYYYCGSTMESGDQSAICVTRQRDQLRARVEELEAARTKAAANSLANMLAHEEALRRIGELHSECDGYMSAATAWKMYAERLEEASGLAVGYAAKGDFESADEVNRKAKQTKPKPEGLR